MIAIAGVPAHDGRPLATDQVGGHTLTLVRAKSGGEFVGPGLVFSGFPASATTPGFLDTGRPVQDTTGCSTSAGSALGDAVNDQGASGRSASTIGTTRDGALLT